MSIESMTTFFGWCSVINIGLLFLTAISLMVMRGFAIKIHSSIFGVNPEDIPAMYFGYIAQYKIAIIILNVVPYFALKIMQLS
ncbi:MAG: hypothetical protein OEY94_08800 [Alphaproteobacteria bacterium]|nr:hypothetical protein [Alphaproteobacteria bacterium]